MPGFHRFVAVSPFPLAVAVSVHRCRWLVGVDDWLANYGTTATEKIELDPVSTEERLRQLFAVYGCNGTEFSFTQCLQNNGIYNGRTAKRQRKNGNGIVETGHQIKYRPRLC